MARDKDNNQISKQMQTYADNINQKMQDIYSTVYSTPRRNADIVDQKMQDIENTVRQIIQRNPSVEVSNITSLFSRVQLRKTLNDKKSNDRLIDAFNDDRITNGLLQDYMQNKWIVDLDNEIDLVCRYLPKLDQALEILKYATLTSDNYSKDFINVQTMDYNKDEMSIFISNAPFTLASSFCAGAYPSESNIYLLALKSPSLARDCIVSTANLSLSSHFSFKVLIAFFKSYLAIPTTSSLI